MKKNLFILILLFWFTPLQAGDFSLDAKARIFIPLDDGIQQGEQIQINARYKNWYLWGSHTSTERRISGQRAGDIDLWAAGLGGQIDILKNLDLWAQVGYYHPQHKGFDGYGSGGAEPLWLYWKKWGEEHDYDVSPYQHFKHKISGNLGGALGVNLKHHFTNHLFIGLDAGYQFLKLKEQFWAGENGGFDMQYIETREHKNFSGGLLGFTIQYQF